MSDADQLVEDLKKALPLDFAGFGGGLATSGPALRPDELLTPAMIAEILKWFDARLGPTDRRAALSIWTGWHFQAVLPSIMAANIFLDRSPALDLNAVGIILSVDLKAVGLKIGPRVNAVDDHDEHSRFAGLLDAYLGPLIKMLARRGAITERVLWSNAGHIFEAFLGKIEGIAGARPGLAAARRLLATPILSDASRNPLFKPVSYIDGRRTRRVCCTRFLFPDGKICSVCPMRLKTPSPSTVHD